MKPAETRSGRMGVPVEVFPEEYLDKAEMVRRVANEVLGASSGKRKK